MDGGPVGGAAHAGRRSQSSPVPGLGIAGTAGWSVSARLGPLEGREDENVRANAPRRPKRRKWRDAETVALAHKPAHMPLEHLVERAWPGRRGQSTEVGRVVSAMGEAGWGGLRLAVQADDRTRPSDVCLGVGGGVWRPSRRRAEIGLVAARQCRFMAREPRMVLSMRRRGWTMLPCLAHVAINGSWVASGATHDVGSSRSPRLGTTVAAVSRRNGVTFLALPVKLGNADGTCHDGQYARFDTRRVFVPDLPGGFL